jgi:hypothetical protein
LSVQNTNLQAKAGVMIRLADKHPDADDQYGTLPHATVALTPGGVALLIYRLTTGGDSSQTRGPNVLPPYWVRLVSEPAGNQLRISGFVSSTGEEWAWQLLGAPVTMDFHGNIESLQVGMAVTACSDPGPQPQPAQSLNQSTFDHVDIDP